MTWDTVPSTLQETLGAYWDGFYAAIPKLAAALVVLAAVWAVVAVARYFIRQIGARTRMRQNLIDVLCMLAGTGFWLMGILIALAIVFPTITPAKALTTLGLGSVAIGFAFKDTFENFLAGILILLREPFAITDYVECEDIDGQIEEITIRDTHVRQTDGQLVVVPNHLLFQNPVTVRTDRDLRRTTVICGVAYGENVDNARSVIWNAVRAVDTVRDDVKDVEVFAQAFGASSVDFEVTWWTGSRPLDIRRSRDQVVAAVKAALDDAGIEIPFPYRTLTFKDPLPVRAHTDTAVEADEKADEPASRA
ncbi:mechanosensitive ion channel family protein [Roseobacter weihaiensis]|uniref:mechanosensitive ion channel family protein n=1 Tax=Roseobacter weihaiensis TaxID=2763262 RepID=UPI001D0BC9BB|nr:mechanosensitive ion channel family protein [Roseobacter sp. H9]